MSAAMNPEERLLDLLSGQATEGLNLREHQELQQLLKSSGMSEETEKFEATAAAFDLAAIPNEDIALPNHLRDQLLIKAGQFFGSPIENDDSFVDSIEEDSAKVELPSNRSNLREMLAWFVAAASIVFGIWIWSINPEDSGAPTTAELIEKIDASVDKNSANWVGVHIPEAEGKVVWSQTNQAGYMVFENLPVNDPEKEQYQLWIFDTDYDQEIPVDGGVFDITEKDGKVYVPFNAKHPVKNAVQFAVTVEIPGGVQRSEREKVPTLAKFEAPAENNSAEDEATR